MSITSTSPGEVTLVDATLDTRVTRHRRNPKRLCGNRGYDSDPLREHLSARGIVLTSPYRDNRVNCPYEDGRRLRTYRHRWIIERPIAWFSAFRRLFATNAPRGSFSRSCNSPALIALRRL